MVENSGNGSSSWRAEGIIISPIWDHSPLAPVLGLQPATTYVICLLAVGSGWRRREIAWTVRRSGCPLCGRDGRTRTNSLHARNPSSAFLRLPDPFDTLPAVTLPLACGSAGFRTLTPSLRSRRINLLLLNASMLNIPIALPTLPGDNSSPHPYHLTRFG